VGLKWLDLPLVGRGFCSDVFDWGNNRVLKLSHADRPFEKIEREYRVTKAVHAAGLPAPAVFDLLELDGRHGIVFERVEGQSLFDITRVQPWKLFEAVEMLAALHVRINRCPAPTELPAQREWIASRIHSVKDMSSAERQDALRRLEQLPDGDHVCHGDFHPANVLLTKTGPVVIDWDTATRGDPIGDLACTSRLLRNAVLPPWSPFYMHWILRATRPIIHRHYLRHYLRRAGGSRSEMDRWHLPLASAAKSLRGPSQLPKVEK